MTRSTCWRVNQACNKTFLISPSTIHTGLSVFAAATKQGEVYSIYYRFKHPIVRATVETMVDGDTLAIPVNWSNIRRWLLIPSEQRFIVKGQLEYPLCHDSKRIQLKNT